MAFPTVPTAAAGRVISVNQANTTATRTFSDLSGLTKNSGDLLIALISAYQTTATANAAFSGWTAGWTEFVDQSSATTMAFGGAYKWSTGSETGTIATTEAATITGHANMMLLSIPGAHATTPPVGATITNDTAFIANPSILTPSWGTDDTLWIAWGASGETSTTGSYTGMGTAPTNYTDYAETGISSDVVGGCAMAVAFRQFRGSAEDSGGFATVDTSNTRNSALWIAVRPAPVVFSNFVRMMV